MSSAVTKTAGRGRAPGPGALPREPAARLEALFDPGSLRFLVPPGDYGVASAAGTVDGMPVAGFASDPRVQGGAMGSAGCAAILAAYERAVTEGAPVIGLWHSGGARLREGVESLHAVGTVFTAMTRASGSVPQISVVLGPAAGGAAYGPALTDIVIMSETASIFVTGPDVVRSVTGQDVDMARLGGPGPHSRRSGLAHVLAATAQQALAAARRAALLLGDQGRVDLAAAQGASPALLAPPELSGNAAGRGRDVRPLVRFLLDAPGLELQASWGPSVVTVLGRLAGRTVGVVASNPSRLDGFLDAAAADKAARFVRMCDGFGVPLAVVVDVPGYLPGASQEWGGLARRAGKLVHAFAEAIVPRVTLVTGRAYGSAAVVMNSKALGATRVFAWRGARLGPGGGAAGSAACAQARGVIDEIVSPAGTRKAVARAIAQAPCRRGVHRNIPL